MRAASPSEQGSRITIIVSLCVAMIIVGMVVIPSIGKSIAKQEQESLINAALIAINRHDSEGLRRVLLRLKPEETRYDLVMDVVAQDAQFPSVSKKPSVLPVLLEAGWSVHGMEGKGMPLLNASSSGRANVVRILLQYGASVNQRYGEEGGTALFAAARANHLSTAKILLESGADPNISLRQLPYRRRLVVGPLPGPPPASVREYEARDKERNDKEREKTEGGTTPLMCAAYSGSEEMVQLLIKHGADPNRKTVTGRTALDFAQRFQKPNVVRLLQKTQPIAVR